MKSQLQAVEFLVDRELDFRHASRIEPFLVSWLLSDLLLQSPLQPTADYLGSHWSGSQPRGASRAQNGEAGWGGGSWTNGYVREKRGEQREKEEGEPLIWHNAQTYPFSRFSPPSHEYFPFYFETVPNFQTLSDYKQSRKEEFLYWLYTESFSGEVFKLTWVVTLMKTRTFWFRIYIAGKCYGLDLHVLCNL